MTTEEKIKALMVLGNFSERRAELCLESYDAIIPVIQKQDGKIIVRVILSFKGRNDVARMFNWIQYKPSQLCEALLRATGKWKE